MNYFGCRADFAVEVGDAVDATGCFVLDFYLRDVHLNRQDNCAGIQEIHLFPLLPDVMDNLPWMAVYQDLPFSTSPDHLLAAVIEDRFLWRLHSTFGGGPVTDSFTLLTFARPEDVILIAVRNDGYECAEPDLSCWQIAGGLPAGPVHWLTVTLPRSAYLHIIQCVRETIEKITKS